MITQEIHVGDIGLAFEAEILEGGEPVNLASATTRQLVFEKADGTVVVVAAALVTDGSDGKMQYVTTLATFLSVAGGWKWQPYLVLPDWTGHADVKTFLVHRNLN